MSRMLPIILAACTASPALAQTALHDNFDCYEPGAPISTLGAGEWWSGGEEGYITSERAFSRPNSLWLERQYADVVHQFRGLSGRLTFSLRMYVPRESVGLEAYIL